MRSSLLKMNWTLTENSKIFITHGVPWPSKSNYISKEDFQGFQNIRKISVFRCSLVLQPVLALVKTPHKVVIQKGFTPNSLLFFL